MCKRAEPLENSKACMESHLSLTYKMENNGLTLDIRQPLHMPDFGFQLYECHNSQPSKLLTLAIIGAIFRPRNPIVSAGGWH